MNRSLLLAAAAIALPVLAHASCDEVKASIDAKLKAKGLSGYSLEVADDASDDGKVVGSCEGGKKIVYTRGAGSDADSGTAPAAASSSAPASASTSGR